MMSQEYCVLIPEQAQIKLLLNIPGIIKVTMTGEDQPPFEFELVVADIRFDYLILDFNLMKFFGFGQ